MVRSHLAAALLAAACARTAPLRQENAPTPTPAPSAPPPPSRPAPAPSAEPPTPPAAVTACHAPSLQIRSPADGRNAAALAACAFTRSGHDDIDDRCGEVPHEVGLARLDEAVLAFDEPTRRRIREIAAAGRTQNRKPRAFGLVGDSITASPKFMSPFAFESPLPPAVADELRLGESDVVAFYRGIEVVPGMDSFVAPRAAKVGAHSGWATPAHLVPTANPVGQLISTHSPAVAVVMFGNNDAAVRFVALDDIVAGYEKRMTRILDQLEAAGIVPILNTVPRHMVDPAMLDCDQAPGDVSNWRLAVQTSAVSAVAANLACKRHLPLIDLRHALDALLNHGLGPDGVHPNAHPDGSGRLDPEALRCGYNARNYVTLKMLREVALVMD